MTRYAVLLLFVTIFLQTLPAQVSDLTWHSFGTKDGLSEATNHFVYKDSRGFVWISSVSGLNRYDGTSAKVYAPDKTDPSSLPNENIQSSFFEDDEKDMWFTTFDGLHKYNYNNDCFDHYQVQDDSAKARLGYYLFHIDPDQYLWFLVEFRMVYTFHIPTGHFKYLGDVDPNSVRCFNVLNEEGYLKRILIRGRDWPGIKVVDVNKDKQIGKPYLLNSADEMMVTGLRQIVPSGDSIYWILRPEAIVKYDVKSGRVTSFPHQGQMDCMAKYKSSRLLIGTASDGIYVFNTVKEQYETSHGINGPLNTNGQLLRISYINTDRDGNIWTSTDGVGLNYARPEKKKFTTYRFSDFFPEHHEIKPLALYEIARDTLLCFTETNGNYLIDLSRGNVHMETYAPLSPLNGYRNNSVCLDTSGKFWINTWSGIFVFDPKAQKIIQATGPSRVASSTFAGPNGHIFFTSTLPGFYEAYLDKGVPNIKSADEQFDQNLYYPVFIDQKQRLWLNNYLKAFEIYTLDSFKRIGTIPMEGFFNAMAESSDGKTLLFGAYNGLFEVDDSTLQLRKIHTPKTGFPATSIFSLLTDEQGHTWIGHTNGISTYHPGTGLTNAYNHEDGLPLTAYTEAACKLRSGRFCFGTIGGITSFYPDSIQPIQTSSIPHVSSLLLNDKSPDPSLKCEETGATHFEDMRSIILPYRNNTVSFSIHALEYSAPASNNILYKMEGLDEDFLKGKNGDHIRYPSMPPGTYRFIMYAFNVDDLRNPLPRTLQITIRPPYYKTWWFYMLVALFSFSIVGYIFYLRFSKKLELQQVRLKLYENLHDDVGSRLTAIVLSAEDLERNERISHPQITSISQIARSIVGNMRRLVWAIDPENDRMTSIVQKITHDKSQILKAQIDFSIEVEPGLRNVILPGEFRYQICSICNESFNNISKYAEASRVAVVISRENKNILLTVEDNGKGFDPEAVQKNELTGSGYGLSNMHRRASRIGGTFRIVSAPGKGTKTEFRFPFKG